MIWLLATSLKTFHSQRWPLNVRQSSRISCGTWQQPLPGFDILPGRHGRRENWQLLVTIVIVGVATGLLGLLITTQ